MMNKANDEHAPINNLAAVVVKEKIEDNDSISEEMHSHSSFMTNSEIDKAS